MYCSHVPVFCQWLPSNTACSCVTGGGGGGVTKVMKIYILKIKKIKDSVELCM